MLAPPYYPTFDQGAFGDYPTPDDGDGYNPSNLPPGVVPRTPPSMLPPQVGPFPGFYPNPYRPDWGTGPPTDRTTYYGPTPDSFGKSPPPWWWDGADRRGPHGGGYATPGPAGGSGPTMPGGGGGAPGGPGGGMPALPPGWIDWGGMPPGYQPAPDGGPRKSDDPPGWIDSGGMPPGYRPTPSGGPTYYEGPGGSGVPGTGGYVPSGGPALPPGWIDWGGLPPEYKPAPGGGPVMADTNPNYLPPGWIDSGGIPPGYKPAPGGSGAMMDSVALGNPAASASMASTPQGTSQSQSYSSGAPVQSSPYTSTPATQAKSTSAPAGGNENDPFFRLGTAAFDTGVDVADLSRLRADMFRHAGGANRLGQSVARHNNQYLPESVRRAGNASAADFGNQTAQDFTQQAAPQLTDMYNQQQFGRAGAGVQMGDALNQRYIDMLRAITQRNNLNTNFFGSLVNSLGGM